MQAQTPLPESMGQVSAGENPESLVEAQLQKLGSGSCDKTNSSRFVNCHRKELAVQERISSMKPSGEGMEQGRSQYHMVITDH